MKTNTIHRLWLLALLLAACAPAKKPQDETLAADKPAGSAITLDYATNFTITTHGASKRVEVRKPYPGAKQGLVYWLVPHGAPAPPQAGDATVVRVPVKNLVCTATTQLPALGMLGLNDRLVGFPARQYISAPAIKARVAAGQVAELGVDSGLNLERLAMLRPALVMAYTLGGNQQQFAQIERMGIPVVMDAAYLEETPLGRAEWVKFTALFFGLEERAEKVFARIKEDYEQLKALADSVAHRPTVFCGTVYKDVWYMPGGQSWAAQLLHDAGADFLWRHESQTGSLALAFEAVYGRAHQADLWIGTDMYRDLGTLAKADKRYTQFAAYQSGQVYGYHRRAVPGGGNDYFETGTARPDLVLKDLVRIIHPGRLPGHTLYYYQPLDRQAP